MTFKKTLGSFVVGIGILFILPFFVFADEGHDDVESHNDIVEVQVISAEPEVFEIGTEEAKAAKGSSPDASEEASREEEHEVGDGHTDHTHAEVSFVVWWQSKTWWTFFLISLLLMAILSFGVYKYLEDKK